LDFWRAFEFPRFSKIIIRERPCKTELHCILKILH
jgi:hypothetical protein